MNFMPTNGNVVSPLPQFNPYQEKMDRYVNLQQQLQQNQQPNMVNNCNPQNTNMNFIVVENLQKAKEQIVPYGYTMWMRDSSEPYQYIKSVDMTGSPSFKVLKVSDVTDEILNSQTDMGASVVDMQYDKFVPIEDFNKLNEKVIKLQSKLDMYEKELSQQSYIKSDNSIKKTPNSKKVGDSNE